MKYKIADRVRLEGMEQYGFGPPAMRKIKVCKVCGNSTPSTLLFCTECGSPLPKKSMYQEYKDRHKFCRICDTVVTDKTEYCPQCGAKING